MLSEMNDSISELCRRVLLTGQRSAISMRLFYLLRRQAANERDRTLELVLDVANRAGTDHCAARPSRTAGYGPLPLSMTVTFRSLMSVPC